MSELTEYFVRHYTLVMDNDYATYHAVTDLAQERVRDSGITRAGWLALDVSARELQFASYIGEAVLNMISALCDEALSDHDHPGGLLMREIMIFSSSDIEYAIGCHYMPEDADIAELLEDDAADDDDSGIPSDFPVRPLTTPAERAAARDLVTDGRCGRSWDDAISTAYTPAPSGRCPFESFHGDDDAEVTA